jgi:hypothetical protein
MSAKLWSSPSANAFQTTLNGTVNDSVTTITLTSTTNLVAPGIVVIDRQDGSGNDTPSKREYVKFTGISGSDLTGVTRGCGGSTAQSHSSGALVESIFSVDHWTDLLDFLNAEHDASGKHVISTATINYTETKNLAVTSVASIAAAYINIATITNLSATTLFYARPGQIAWSWIGSLPTITTSTATHFPLVRASRNWTITNIYISVLSAPSLAIAQFDINYLSTPTSTAASIFSTKPTIDIGEYETVTAATQPAFSLTSLASGTLLLPEIEAPGGAGDVTISLLLKERS